MNLTGRVPDDGKSGAGGAGPAGGGNDGAAGNGVADACAVVTIVHGRHAHLMGQLWGLARQTRRPEQVVVVAMDDAEVSDLVAAADLPGTTVVEVPSARGGLPLAAARNAGARTLVFLDVDCIPEEDTVRRYAEVVGQHATPVVRHPTSGAGSGPDVFCGGVAYLPPVADATEYRTPGVGQRATAHPARALPAPGTLTPAHDLNLFWSLSFAVNTCDWDRLGGFCEEYQGYGGEDTDFAQILAARGGRLWWVGGAEAYHQHHPVQSPPRHAAPEIVRNANVFHGRWGWFPMEGWLEAFESEGLATRSADGTWQPRPPSVSRDLPASPASPAPGREG